jgi:hypothetical protein
MVARLVALTLLLAGPAAAEVGVRATVEPPQIRLGEVAALEFEVDGAQNAAVPELPAVDGLTFRYLGPSTQVSIVNGRMSQKVAHRFSVSAARRARSRSGRSPSWWRESDTRRRRSRSRSRLPAPRAGQATGAGTDQLRLVLAAGRAKLYLHERVPLRLELWVGSVRVSERAPAVPGEGVAIEKLLEEPTQRRRAPSMWSSSGPC